MHNGYLQVEGEKMSKSLGNFYTVRDLTSEFPGEAIRFALLSTHYRAPMDFTKESIQNAKEILNRFYGALRNSQSGSKAEIPEKIMGALCDDLNTPLVISHLHELVGSLNKASDEAEAKELRASLLAGAEVLGLLSSDPEEWFKGLGGSSEGALGASAIQELIEKRIAARAAKDFATSDKIRDELAEQGIVLEDGAGITTWKRA
jgi:cysteinyl-tRNA synthetase